jgi:hypothetical protein
MNIRPPGSLGLIPRGPSNAPRIPGSPAINKMTILGCYPRETRSPQTHLHPYKAFTLKLVPFVDPTDARNASAFFRHICAPRR